MINIKDPPSKCHFKYRQMTIHAQCVTETQCGTPLWVMVILIIKTVATTVEHPIVKVDVRSVTTDGIQILPGILRYQINNILY